MASEPVSASAEEPPSPGGWQEAPLWSFVKSEAGAAAATVVVYGLFRAAAFGAERIDHVFPLADAGPAQFLSTVLGWGSALGASATFLIVTGYQLLVLVLRLREEGRR